MIDFGVHLLDVRLSNVAFELPVATNKIFGEDARLRRQ